MVKENIKVIRIALIGCGYWGSRVLKVILRMPGIELVSVYDEDPNRLQQVSHICRDSVDYADSYRRLLEDDSIDAVVLTVPAIAHFELARQALTAGKHVFVEKPFTETLVQAEHLHDLAKEKNLMIHVDHIMVYHPAIQKMKELIETGCIGEIRYMQMDRSSFGGTRSDVGVLQDLGVHDVAIIDYLTGGAEPEEVCSMGEKMAFSHMAIAFTLLKYPGFSAELTTSWISPIKERRVVLGGTDKTLVFDDIAAPDKLMMYDSDDPEDLQILQLEEGNALENSLAQFGEVIRSRVSSLTDAASAVRVMKTLERM